MAFCRSTLTYIGTSIQMKKTFSLSGIRKQKQESTTKDYGERDLLFFALPLCILSHASASHILLLSV